MIKELLVKCFGAGERGAESEDAFLRDYVQRQQWKDEDEPTGVVTGSWHDFRTRTLPAPAAASMDRG